MQEQVRSLQKSDDSTGGEHQEAGTSSLERAAPTLQEKARADLQRSALSDSGRLTPEEVGQAPKSDNTRHAHQKKERGRVTSLSPLDHPCCLFLSTVQPKTTHRLKLGFVHTQVRHKTFRRNVTTRHRQPNHRHHCPPQVSASQRHTPKLLDL